jgi:multiple sugar transport system substrate-binding protein
MYITVSRSDELPLSRRRLLSQVGIASSALVLGAAISTCRPVQPQQQPQVQPAKLSILTHYEGQQNQSVMQPLLDQFTQQNPRIELDYQTVPFDQLLNKIITTHAGGVPPDVFHIYSLWLPELSLNDVLAAPPADAIADIRQAYARGSVEGASYRNQVWGYPTEVNSYLSIYNRSAFQEAGVSRPPTTWTELKEIAPRLTKRDADGKTVQGGMILITGWDSGVVHPFIALLWSNGGRFVSDDNTRVLFNELPGQQTLQLTLDLIDMKAVDLALKQADFLAGREGMIIMANWWRTTLKNRFPGGLDNVGVAAIPRGSGPESTLQYLWLWAVDKATKAAPAAW